MALKVTRMSLFLVLLAIFLDVTAAQSDCTRTIMGLSPCLNYVSGNSSTPSSSCCSQLSNVVQSQPQCLCTLLNGGATSFGVTINQTLALALPGACNVQTPPVSRCSEVNGPPSSPADTPADASKQKPDVPSTSSGSDVPSGGGSKTTKDGSSTGGSNIRAPFSIGSFMLFVASCAFAAMGF